MLTLTGENIYLRALEPEDLDFIYAIENDEQIWEMSSTQTPYSRFLIKQYLENAHKDIYEAKQLRLVICSNDHATLGLIDLYDFNPMHNRAGVGILIAENENRENYGFVKVGVKKEWNLVNTIYKDEFLYQLLYVH